MILSALGRGGFSVLVGLDVIVFYFPQDFGGLFGVVRMLQNGGLVSWGRNGTLFWIHIGFWVWRKIGKG